MASIYQYKSFDLSVKDVDIKAQTVSGYFSSFGVVDAYGDVMMKGAFAKTIKEQGPASSQPRIKHLMNHDVTMPIGKIIDLKEDDFGLFYVSQIGSNNAGQDFLKMVESGLITEHSIGFKTITEKKSKQGGQDVNELHELKLYEGSSLTGWGVNQYTPLIQQVKSADQLKGRLKRLEKFIKDSTATDECIESLMLEVKQLTQLIEDMQSKEATTEPVKTTSPDEKALDLNAIALHLLTN